MIDRDALRAWVEASCIAQGLPLVVSDPGVIAGVGAVVRLSVPRGRPRQGPERGALNSHAPIRDDAVGVDGVTRRARKDGGAFENGGDDGCLAR